ncbi:MAG: diguanylate cyclase [Planctomycetes bacterium]|nr:diguanylate cyclase [Planctomycetota bacterium]
MNGKTDKGIGLRAKLAIIIILYSVAALAMVSIFFNRQFQQMSIESYHLWANFRTSQWRTLIRSDFKETEIIPALPSKPAELPWRDEYSPLIADEQVAVIISTGEKVGTIHKPSGAIDRFPDSFPPDAVGGGTYLNNDGMFIFVPLDSDPTGRWLCCWFPYPDGTGRLNNLYTQLAIIACIISLLAIVLGLAADSAIVRPILDITAATESAAMGELEQNLRIETGDELETLSTRFNEMLKSMKLMQEFSLDASPLTGLPGNNSICNKIEDALESNRQCTVLYADIDNFKAYNDVYGIKEGDRAILYTANTLETALTKNGIKDSFVGHVGGDDFIIIVPMDKAEEVCQSACLLFDDGAPEFYNKKDRDRGGIRAKDRQGVTRSFPLMAISIAGIPLVENRFAHFSEVASVAAELKKKAKSKKGSAFVIDKRSGSPTLFERDSDHFPAI